MNTMNILTMGKNKHRLNRFKELHHVNHYQLGLWLIVRQGSFVEPLRKRFTRFTKYHLVAQSTEKDPKAGWVERLHVRGSR